MLKTPSTDRRTHERFDVLGPLWGVLSLPEVARVMNVSTSGMLVEAAVCPPLGSVQAVVVRVDGDAVRVDAVVRHCRPVSGTRMRIGLEFLEAPGTVLHSIEQLGDQKQIEVIDLSASKS